MPPPGMRAAARRSSRAPGAADGFLERVRAGVKAVAERLNVGEDLGAEQRVCGVAFGFGRGFLQGRPGRGEGDAVVGEIDQRVDHFSADNKPAHTTHSTALAVFPQVTSRICTLLAAGWAGRDCGTSHDLHIRRMQIADRRHWLVIWLRES